MNIYYVICIIGIVVFLGTSIMVFRTVREKIKNGFAFENEGDLKWHTIALSVGSFIFLALCVGAIALYSYVEHHWIVTFFVMLALLVPSIFFIVCLGLPLQTLGVIYSVAYLKKSQKRIMPIVYIVLASISWLVMLAMFIKCIDVVWILFV